MYLAEAVLSFFYQVMPEVKQEAGAIGVKAAGRWAVPGDDIGDWQARHPVVGQSQVAVLLAAPDREEEGGEEAMIKNNHSAQLLFNCRSYLRRMKIN